MIHTLFIECIRSSLCTKCTPRDELGKTTVPRILFENNKTGKFYKIHLKRIKAIYTNPSEVIQSEILISDIILYEQSFLKLPSKIDIISHSKNLSVNLTKTDGANCAFPHTEVKIQG
jgi:hypothetical protein